jgi:hypothetical protein
MDRRFVAESDRKTRLSHTDSMPLSGATVFYRGFQGACGAILDCNPVYDSKTTRTQQLLGRNMPVNSTGEAALNTTRSFISVITTDRSPSTFLDS